MKNNNFKKTLLLTALVLSFSVSAEQAIVHGTSTQSAMAIGDMAFVKGSGSLIVDPIHVSANGAGLTGSLNAFDKGMASGHGVAVFKGGVTGDMNLKANEGKIIGDAKTTQYALSQTTKGGIAASTVGGNINLKGFVTVPVDPFVSAKAHDFAHSLNNNGTRATSIGFSGGHVDLTAILK